MNSIKQTIKRILMESHIPPPIYLRRRFSEDELNKIFRDSVDYVLQSEGYKHLALKRKKEVVAAYMMDDLHPVLSNSGTQDFNYDEIFNYLVHYYSPKIEKIFRIQEQNIKEDTKKKLSSYQKLVDNVVTDIKYQCETQDFESEEIITFDACDFIESLTEVKVVEITRDNTIKLILKYESIFASMDEESFTYELKREIKKYGNIKIEIIDSINTKDRQW
jgi:hypothetical protein